MAPADQFAIVYDVDVKEHLRAIERRNHELIRSAIEAELVHEPNVETRNRKPLKRPVAFEAQWELRCGPGNRFRVFYEIDVNRHEVHVLAIGIKQGDCLQIGGEDIEL